MKNNISFWLEYCISSTPQTYTLLEQAGYQHDWIQHGDLGGIKAWIDGNFFSPDPEGAYWIAQPVWYSETPTPIHYVENPILDDIIVWQPEQPERWYFFRGETGLILGEQNLLYSQLTGEKAVLHRTPFEWLKAGSTGAVLLDKHGLHRLLDVQEIVCMDVNYGAQIKERLNSYCLRQMPRFYIRTGQGAQP